MKLLKKILRISIGIWICWNSNINIVSARDHHSKSPVPYDLLDVDCLALNIYHEARGEGSTSNLATVGHVTLNRVKDSEWPDTICKVVYELRKNKFGNWIPMYSWTKDSLTDIPLEFTAYNTSLIIARKVINGELRDNTGGATHYHATYIDTPYWANNMIITLKVGKHIFYK